MKPKQPKEEQQSLSEREVEENYKLLTTVCQKDRQ